MSAYISDSYLAEQRRLHEERFDYGTASLQFGEAVSNLVDAMQCDTLLDYGCGKGRLMHVLNPQRDVRVQLYDPAVPKFSGAPEPADCVTCIDVLEHIEPEHLSAVLDHLSELTRRVLFLSVHTGSAAKTLSDGRNAHLIQRPPEWWLSEHLLGRFKLFEFRRNPHGFAAVLEPRDEGG